MSWPPISSSTASLLGLMAGYLWVLEGRRPIRTRREALAIRGLGGADHPVRVRVRPLGGRDSWSNLLGAYNLAEGRVWAVVPLWTLLGPEVIRRLRVRR